MDNQITIITTSQGKLLNQNNGFLDYFRDENN